MNKQIRKYLISIARRKGIVHYQELCDHFNLNLNMRERPHDRKEIGRILGEISTFEHNKDGRPLLSALVLSKSFEEGDGFFKLAEELGFGNWRRLKSGDIFQSQEMNRCYDYWQNESKYIKYVEDEN